MIIIFRDVGKMRTCVPRNVHDISGIATIKHTYCNFTVFCIPEIASRNKNDILYFARIKYMNVVVPLPVAFQNWLRTI